MSLKTTDAGGSDFFLDCEGAGTSSDPAKMKRLDAGSGRDVSWGVLGEPVSSADMTTAVAVSDAPASGKKLVVTDFVVGADTAMRFDFLEETTNTVLHSAYLQANTTHVWKPRGKKKLATADKKIKGRASTAGNVRVNPGYFSES